MNTPNIGWLYFKDYLRVNNSPSALFSSVQDLNKEPREKVFEEHFAQKNKTILEQVFSPNISMALISELAKSNISLKTTYPGLTLGTGYTHGINETGEFKLGFFFDHTTGYPCIPGSTVKGCLRGMFPQKEQDGSDELSNASEKYNYLASVIRELSNLKEGIIAENELGEKYDQKEHPKRKSFIDRLELEIFEGKIPVKKEDGTIENQPNCIYERDIFFDAYLISTDHPAIHRSNYQNPRPFIGDDYITPHINRKRPELSPFTNPIPLMFLKILPEVTILFQFDLKSREDGLLTKEQKEQLFRRLLLDFGIGAKTNVGYGQFDDEMLESHSIKGIIEKHKSDDSIPIEVIGNLIKNKSFKGTITAKDDQNITVGFDVIKKKCLITRKAYKYPDLNTGDAVTIKINQDYIPGSLLNCKFSAG